MAGCMKCEKCGFKTSKGGEVFAKHLRDHGCMRKSRGNQAGAVTLGRGESRKIKLRKAAAASRRARK